MLEVSVDPTEVNGMYLMEHLKGRGVLQPNMRTNDDGSQTGIGFSFNQQAYDNLHVEEKRMVGDLVDNASRNEYYSKMDADTKTIWYGNQTAGIKGLLQQPL